MKYKAIFFDIHMDDIFTYEKAKILRKYITNNYEM